MFHKTWKKYIRNFVDNIGTITDRYLFDLSGRIEDTIWIVGDGRSGTTWVSNLINYHNKYRYMFEPFHPGIVEYAKRFRFFQYVKPEDFDHYLYEIYCRIFSGRIQHKRIDRYNQNLFYNGRIVKDIFSHLFIKWMVVHFPGVKKIIVLRHPFAVVLSKMRLKEWFWMEDPSDFLSQNLLIEDFLKPFVDIIKSADGYFEKQIVIWSIIHYVPFKQLKEGEVHITFYEELCINPEKEIRRLFSFLGDKKNDHTLDPRVMVQFRKPSQTTHQNSAINTNQNLINGWRKVLSDTQIKMAVKILKAFGLDAIYNDSLMPNCDAAYNILKS